MIRIERRSTTSAWLEIGAPLGALLVALILVAMLLAAVGINPLTTYSSMIEVAFTSDGGLSATLVQATPLLFTGLCAVVAFRMRVYNIGGEGQLYIGAVATLATGLLLAGQSPMVVIPAMICTGVIAGALWAAIPGLLRSYLDTNEILTSLMLNYVAGLLMVYLIFTSESYWRDVISPAGRVYPQSKQLEYALWWPSWNVGGMDIPLGLVVGILFAVGISVMFTRTTLGFRMRVVAGSPTAARYAGFKVNRLMLFVMLFSGALAGLGGASQIGDFTHQLDPRGLQAAQYGYTGIVVAALAGFRPLAVILSAVFFGALLNASVALNGPTFPEGLVGTIEGIIIFCVVGAALATNYRLRGQSAKPQVEGESPAGPERKSATGLANDVSNIGAPVVPSDERVTEYAAEKARP